VRLRAKGNPREDHLVHSFRSSTPARATPALPCPLRATLLPFGDVGRPAGCAATSSPTRCRGPDRCGIPRDP
jgi:hypothetical protein